MPDPRNPDETRRQLLRTLVVAPVVLASPTLLGLAGCAAKDDDAATSAASLQPTLACGDDDDDAEATPEQTEGPFFTPKSPERRSLIESGMAGTRLVVTGTVLTRSCKPIAGALLDFWHTDDGGEYDNVGYRLRGHQYTDAKGAYRLETIVPGLYPGRTRHIHVKAQAPGQRILTTQLYFPGESRNGRDGIFHRSLLMQLADGANGREGRFDFVLDVA